MVAAFKLESLAGIVGIRIERAKLIQDRAPRRKRWFRNPFVPIRLLRISILQLLRGDFCNKIPR